MVLLLQQRPHQGLELLNAVTHATGILVLQIGCISTGQCNALANTGSAWKLTIAPYPVAPKSVNVRAPPQAQPSCSLGLIATGRFHYFLRLQKLHDSRGFSRRRSLRCDDCVAVPEDVGDSPVDAGAVSNAGAGSIDVIFAGGGCREDDGHKGPI